VRPESHPQTSRNWRGLFEIACGTTFAEQYQHHTCHKLIHAMDDDFVLISSN
jgi:hypothetical protein